MNNKSLLQQVDQYIEENASRINPRYRHTYHMMPPLGWMNDPNGFSFFNNHYHMFYQYYPYDTSWGPMFWGHMISTNFMDWQIQPTAIAPGESYDQQGIFSGTAIDVNGEMWVYYTGHREPYLRKNYDDTYRKRAIPLTTESIDESGVEQVQCLAVSKDGISFEKKGVVIGRELIRQNGRIEDFRDPKVWRHGDKFYMVVGSKSLHYRAQVLFYVSNDGIEWEYLNYFSLGKEYGAVWECPDIFELQGAYILIVSPQGKPSIEDQEMNGTPVNIAKHENIFGTFAFLGDFDHETGQFSVQRSQDLDYGFDFYAPQSIEDADGDRVLMAWMNMWMRDYVLHNSNHGWNGAMTIPRVLSISNERLYQYPVKSVEDYRQHETVVSIDTIEGHYENDVLSGDAIDLEMEFNMTESDLFEIEFFKGIDKQEGREEGLKLSFDKTRDEMTLDRSGSTMINECRTKEQDYLRKVHIYLNKPIRIRVLLDISSCEIFINDGEYVMTSLFYKALEKSEIHFKSKGTTTIHHLVKWEMTKSLKY